MQIENCWVNLLSVFGPVAVWRLVPLPQPRAAVVAAATVSAAGAASVYSSGLRSPLLSSVAPQSASDPAGRDRNRYHIILSSHQKLSHMPRTGSTNLQS